MAVPAEATVTIALETGVDIFVVGLLLFLLLVVMLVSVVLVLVQGHMDWRGIAWCNLVLLIIIDLDIPRWVFIFAFVFTHVDLHNSTYVCISMCILEYIGMCPSQ